MDTAKKGKRGLLHHYYYKCDTHTHTQCLFPNRTSLFALCLGRDREISDGFGVVDGPLFLHLFELPLRLRLRLRRHRRQDAHRGGDEGESPDVSALLPSLLPGGHTDRNASLPFLPLLLRGRDLKDDGLALTGREGGEQSRNGRKITAWARTYGWKKWRQERCCCCCLFYIVISRSPAELLLW